MKALVLETDAAATAAGRDPQGPHINPILRVIAGAIGPILGLFRSRETNPPADVRTLKLETYRSSPAPAAGRGGIKAVLRQSKGSAYSARPLGNSHQTVVVRGYRRRRPGLALKPATGGLHHG